MSIKHPTRSDDDGPRVRSYEVEANVAGRDNCFVIYDQENEEAWLEARDQYSYWGVEVMR